MYLFKNKKIIIAIIMGVIIIALFFVGIYYFKKQGQVVRKCDFQIVDLKEYKGKYGESEEASNYFIYEGLIKNNSQYAERLEAMIAKLYNDKNIYIGEGYTSLKSSVNPGVSVPFKVQIVVSTYHDTVLRKYFNESTSFRPDIYPWFITCK